MMCGSSFESVLRNFSLRVGAEALDEFRSHLKKSLASSETALQDRYSSLVDDEFECLEHREHFEGALSDEAWQLDQIKYLGDSLAIVGLYRLVETQLTKAILANHPSMGEKEKAAVIAGETNLVKPRKLLGYHAANELRLINNSVKHEDSKVTPKLARGYRSWKMGERMENLDIHYDRLKPEVEFHSYLTGNSHLRNSAVTINNIYSDIFSNEEYFRPSIFLSDYSEMPFKGKKSPLRLVSEKVGVILNIYKDLVEVISKQYIVIVGLRNIKNSKSYDVFKKRTVHMSWGAISANNLAEFSSLDLGVKTRFMEGCLYYNDLKAISSRIRNSIAHNNWEYNELTQKVTFRFTKNVDEKSNHKNSQTKTMLEINSEVINLFRLMHKLNTVNYLFGCFYGHRDFGNED